MTAEEVYSHLSRPLPGPLTTGIVLVPIFHRHDHPGLAQLLPHGLQILLARIDSSGGVLAHSHRITELLGIESGVLDAVVVCQTHDGDVPDSLLSQCVVKSATAHGRIAKGRTERRVALDPLILAFEDPVGDVLLLELRNQLRAVSVCNAMVWPQRCADGLILVPRILDGTLRRERLCTGMLAREGDVI